MSKKTTPRRRQRTTDGGYLQVVLGAVWTRLDFHESDGELEVVASGYHQRPVTVSERRIPVGKRRTADHAALCLDPSAATFATHRHSK